MANRPIDRFDTLLETLVASTRGSPLSEIADKAVRHACALLDADGGSVTEVRGSKLHYIAGFGMASGFVGRVVDRGGSFTGEVVEQRVPRVFRVGAASRASSQRARQSDIRCGLVAPIVFGDEVIGTLGVASSTEGHFDESDLATIERLAGFVAGEVTRRIERIERERELAWSRLERLGAVLSCGKLARLGEARAALEKAAHLAEQRTPLAHALQQAVFAIDAATMHLTEARLGDAADRAGFVEPDSRPVSLTPPRLEGLHDVRVVVRAELEHAAAFAHHGLGRLATFESDLAVPDDIAIQAVPGLLSELVVDLLVDRIDRIPAGYRRRFGLELVARLNGARDAVEIEVRCPELEPGLTIRDDADLDPFSATRRGSLANALASRAASALGASLELGETTARVMLPLGAPHRSREGQ